MLASASSGYEATKSDFRKTNSANTMSTAHHEAPPEEPGDDAADLAKAFQELAKYVIYIFSHSLPQFLELILGLVLRGEQAASAMENQLTALERKIDALLESAEGRIDSALEGVERRLDDPTGSSGDKPDESTADGEEKDSAGHEAGEG
ncbi:MAG: hypothetical protein Q9218_000033 [Villophora microphyllina]